MTAPVPHSLLEVRRLSRRFGGVRAVDEVSFTIPAGRTVALIGPNGSGKTTLFNLICGLVTPDGGEVHLNGRPVTGLPPERIAELGVARTFQNGRVFGNMPVRDNVLVGMHTRLRAARPLASLQRRPVVHWVSLLAETAAALLQPPRVRTEEAACLQAVHGELGRFGDRLLPRERRPAYSLSYANRRRLEIARALALRPRLLLLDEPTAGMNPTETGEMLEQIRALGRAGHTIMLIEHKLDLVMALAEHVIVMDEGRVIAEGPPGAVQADPQVIEAYLGRPSGRRPAGTEARQPAAAVQPEEQRAGIRPVPSAEVSTAEARGPRARPTPEPAARAAGPLLRLEGVDAFYGPLQALAGVSLRVDAGEIVCLLGGNASGKSTTMKVVLGLLRPRAGRVLVDGRDVTGWPTPARIRTGLASVPEARRLFPAMNVDENLLMGSYLRRDPQGIRDDLERAYGLFPRLRDRRRQLAGTLSGGEQQMLAIARALMSRPRLVCMDEPTMGLAPKFVESVLDTIAAVNRTGVGVFMVEQNATLALSVAHRGYVLQNGSLVMSGAAQELLENPAIQEAYLGRHRVGRLS